MTAPALLECDRGIAVLRFNRPDRMNVLGLDGDGEAIASLLAEARLDPSIRVLVITGEGKAFSAGGDLKSMQSGALSGPAPQVQDIYQRTVGTLASAIEGFDLPIIAAVNGPAIGLGCGIACLADIRIASEKARFAMPFVKLGLIPGDGSLQRLVEIVGKESAARMLFTGQPIDAHGAAEWGLVGSVVPHEEILEAAMQLALEIAAHPPRALKALKSLFRAAGHLDQKSFRDMSIGYQAILHQTADFSEGVAALLEKRPPRFTGD